MHNFFLENFEFPAISQKKKKCIHEVYSPLQCFTIVLLNTKHKQTKLFAENLIK